MRRYHHVVERFTFITGNKGVFDFRVNDQLLCSKKALGRHAEPGEILRIFQELIGPAVPQYQES